jgi:hypothetical protein
MTASYSTHPQFLAAALEKGLADLRRRLNFGTPDEQRRQLWRVQLLNWELGASLKKYEAAILKADMEASIEKLALDRAARETAPSEQPKSDEAHF